MADPSDRTDEQGPLAAMVAGAEAGLAAVVDERVVAVTDRWCDCWGVDRDAVVGGPVAEVVPAGVAVGTDEGASGSGTHADGTSETDTRVDDSLPDPGETARFERDGADGDPRTVEVSADTAAVDGTEYLVYTCRDVTDRVALERDSNVLDALFEHVPVYLFVKDEQGRHTRVSDNVGDPEEYLGKTDRELYGEDLASDTYADDMRVIDEGEPILNREEFNPERNHFFLTSKVPWRDGTGEIRGLIGVTRDVTDRERQRRQLERQNERLRTVASVISHDIRNPLQVAKGRLDLAADECDSENVDRAAEAIDRMGDLLEELLALVRQGQWIQETELVSMETVAERCWETAAPPTATLALDQEFYFEADEARLQELLENLFRNAVVHGGEDVTVRVGPMNDWSGFYVADDGPGIPEDEREDVFESGYTTAEEGTGFGLAIVEVIAEAHGWEVRLAKSESGGARFEFVGVEFE